jgi:hypothetical protein
MRTYSGSMKIGTTVFIVAILASTLVDAHMTAPFAEATNFMQVADAFVEQSASSDDVQVFYPAMFRETRARRTPPILQDHPARHL